MENKLLVGITHGDVNGIGYEAIIKLMADNKICEICTPLLFGSSKAAAYHRKTLNIENFNLNSIQHPRESNLKRCNIINCDDDVRVDFGHETPESDEAAKIAMHEALTYLNQNEIDVLVAAPQGISTFAPAISMEAYYSKFYEVRNVMPLLVGEKLKMGFVCGTNSFKNISENLTFNNIFYKLRLLDSCLQDDFNIKKPHIAVLGLNPYAGENGLYGEEEKNIIIPAIEKARNLGIMALGPYSPESLFGGTEYTKFDVILALHHEQGILPFQAIEGNIGACLFAGLPSVITTTVHGMAYDIVGQDKADESGMRNAIYLAIDVYNNRKLNQELKENPLRHYDIASNSNESDLNVEQIAGIAEVE